MNEVYMIITIGIDVSKSKLDIWTSKNEFGSINNDTNFILNYFNKFKEGYSEVQIVLEATGKYHRIAHSVLANMGYKLMIVNPYQARNFAKAHNKFCKTDKVDAKVLCAFGQQMGFKESRLRSDKEEEILELSRRKTQLQDHLRIEKNRIKNSYPATESSIKDHIKHLEGAIKNIDKALECCVKRDKETEDKVAILESVPAIGKTSAISIIAHVPEIGTLSRREIAALTGTAPMNNDSGDRKGKRSIKRGRCHIRSSLYMPMLTAIRFNPTIKKFYNRLIENGKPAKVAITACMRKLITILNLMVKNNQKWNLST